jgi:hypothetical protein
MLRRLPLVKEDEVGKTLEDMQASHHPARMEQRSRGTPIVGSRCLAVDGEDIEALMFGVVVWSVCYSYLYLCYNKQSVNPIINPNPLSRGYACYLLRIGFLAWLIVQP